LIWRTHSTHSSYRSETQTNMACSNQHLQVLRIVGAILGVVLVIEGIILLFSVQSMWAFGFVVCLCVCGVCVCVCVLCVCTMFV